MLVASLVISATAFGRTPTSDDLTCNWKTQDYKLEGDGMRCITRTPKGDRLWYSMNRGLCSLLSATATTVEFTFKASSGILFTDMPYKDVLSPSPSEAVLAELSDLARYENKAVALLFHPNAPAYDLDMQVHLGTLQTAADGMAVLVGERLVGEDYGPDQELHGVPCVLNAVKKLDGRSPCISLLSQTL